jgi:hypothetical protein
MRLPSIKPLRGGRGCQVGETHRWHTEQRTKLEKVPRRNDIFDDVVEVARGKRPTSPPPGAPHVPRGRWAWPWAMKLSS